jgi:preprotein translocase subunit SecA
MVTEEEQLEIVYKTLEVWVDIPEEIVPENIHAVRRESLKEDLTDLIIEHYEKRGEELRQQALLQGGEGIEPQREFERTYLLQVVDRLWMDHIDSLDVMRAGIGLRSVGQRDPLVEFKNEAFNMFEELKAAIQRYTVDALLKLMRNELSLTLQRPEPQRKALRNLQTNAEAIAQASGQSKSDTADERPKGQSLRRGNKASRSHNNGRAVSAPNRAASASNGASRPQAPGKVGRNDPCPCGSGKKYKKCHGA